MPVGVPGLVFETPLWLALLTVGVSAMEGAVIGRESRTPRYDLVGVFVLAVVLGLAGGIARDVLIGNLPVVAVRTPWYLATVAGVTVLVLLGRRFIPPLTSLWFVVLDALSLGLYTAVGIGYALQAGVSVVGALFVGVIAGVTGGVLVALLRGVTPEVLVPSVFYALIALAGAGLYVAVEPRSPAIASISCVALVVTLRIVAVRWRLGTRPLPLVGDRSGGGAA